MKPAGLILAAILSLPVIAIAGYEEATPPNQVELLHLLSGNTVYGTWAGRTYQQYFSPSGATRYQERDGPETEGIWRINEHGHYCSVWPPASRWVCYGVRVDGNDIYWQSGDDYYPSEVKPGNLF